MIFQTPDYIRDFMKYSDPEYRRAFTEGFEAGKRAALEEIDSEISRLKKMRKHLSKADPFFEGTSTTVSVSKKKKCKCRHT